jgi:hypothetical protein
MVTARAEAGLPAATSTLDGHRAPAPLRALRSMNWNCASRRGRAAAGSPVDHAIGLLSTTLERLVRRIRTVSGANALRTIS